MTAWNALGSVVVACAFISTGYSQTYDLTEKMQNGDCSRVELAMNLTGEMRIARNEKTIPLKMVANASHGFTERTLVSGAGVVIQKTARTYDEAKATISVGGDRTERKLRPERRLVVAQHHKGHAIVYCPSGSFTRAEMELTSEHFDTLALPGLLPGKTVNVGESWNVSNEVAQFLCGFEGLSTQDLACKLEEVTGEKARVSVTGSATGIELGAFVKLTIQARYHFDLTAKRIVSVVWKQNDERGQGPASPHTIVETVTTMKRKSVSPPDSLADTALVPVPDGFEPPPFMTQLLYEHSGPPKLSLNYSRDWTLVGRTLEHIVFRLMERGDFVAQATITPWDSARPGQHMTPAAFREAMARTPGWVQGDVVQEGEVPAERGYWTYRIAAPGEMDGLRVLQNFFLIAGPTGDQLVVVFTMTPAQVEKLGTRDLEFIHGLGIAARSSK